MAWEGESRALESTVRSEKRIWECRPVARPVKLPSLAAPVRTERRTSALFIYLFIYLLSRALQIARYSEYIESYPFVLPICPLSTLHSPQIPRPLSANLISSTSQMDTQPQFEPALHLKAESASAYEFSLDMDHRRRRRNRTTQSCLNCHTSKRKVRPRAPSSSSCPSFRHSV